MVSYQIDFNNNIKKLCQLRAKHREEVKSGLQCIYFTFNMSSPKRIQSSSWSFLIKIFDCALFVLIWAEVVLNRILLVTIC